MRESYNCIVYGRGSQWEGICLDLDIAVHASSFEDIRRLLSDAVSTYISDADREDARTRARLLSRRAPLRVRAYWAVRLALAALRGRKDTDLPVGYLELCPA